ncbi:MAG: FecR family protein [Prolixibacteraceae bacterium]|jgi:ferric-dicitrate binding protein FerR (iron transport regulator)|nr:FecR family protein [Prolixibacteraceae bacterium]
MKIDSKYKNYTVDDFVQDKDFRCWINSPNEILSSFWLNFQRDYPEKSELVELASQIVKALFIEERAISKDEYQGSIDQLKTYLDKRKYKAFRLSVNWRNVAAVLLLPVMALSIYLYTSRTLNQASGRVVQYIVPDGQKSKVILADGTQVWLNSGSTLSVSMDNDNQRKVQLSGEAFFNVTKDRKVPFLVETKEYSVKVYGTQFDVRVYKDQIESETILKEGLISILTNSKKEIKMSPGQRFFLDSEKKYTLSEVNPDIYMSWKDNVLKINNEKLQDLLVRLEHWYGVKIKVDNYDRVKDLKYTLTIKTESLKEMLDLMNYVTPLNYKIDGESVILKYNFN